MKRLILVPIHMSICNFRCSYCYLSQRPVSFQGQQIDWKYSPDYIKKAFSKKRLGGECYFNFCADGETLLVKDIDKYVRVLLEEGHLVEIVTNLTITNTLEKLLNFEKRLLKLLTFKCSFHYLELKEKNLLGVFSSNINKIWNSGASATVEMVAADIYIPYISEIKQFSLQHFGALPHVTIPRNDKGNKKIYTNLSILDFFDIWSTFDSDFFKFKKELYNVKRNEFCYAGYWSIAVSLSTGDACQCYSPDRHFNIFDDIDSKIPWYPICRCKQPYCYNGHSLLSVGLIPTLKTPKYGTNIRNRYNAISGNNWYSDDALAFLDGKLADSNQVFGLLKKATLLIIVMIKRHYYRLRLKIDKSLRKNG